MPRLRGRSTELRDGCVPAGGNRTCRSRIRRFRAVNAARVTTVKNPPPHPITRRREVLHRATSARNLPPPSTRRRAALLEARQSPAGWERTCHGTVPLLVAIEAPRGMATVRLHMPGAKAVEADPDQLRGHRPRRARWRTNAAPAVAPDLEEPVSIWHPKLPSRVRRQGRGALGPPRRPRGCPARRRHEPYRLTAMTMALRPLLLERPLQHRLPAPGHRWRQWRYRVGAGVGVFLRVTEGNPVPRTTDEEGLHNDAGRILLQLGLDLIGPRTTRRRTSLHGTLKPRSTRFGRRQGRADR